MIISWLKKLVVWKKHSRNKYFQCNYHFLSSEKCKNLVWYTIINSNSWKYLETFILIFIFEHTRITGLLFIILINIKGYCKGLLRLSYFYLYRHSWNNYFPHLLYRYLLIPIWILKTYIQLLHVIRHETNQPGLKWITLQTDCEPKNK